MRLNIKKVKENIRKLKCLAVVTIIALMKRILMPNLPRAFIQSKSNSRKGITFNKSGFYNGKNNLIFKFSLRFNGFYMQKYKRLWFLVG